MKLAIGIAGLHRVAPTARMVLEVPDFAEPRSGTTDLGGAPAGRYPPKRPGTG